MKNFEFLYSTRFWAIVIGAFSVYAKLKGWIGEPEMTLIAAITGGFTLVRTADRMSEQKVIAAGVATGEMKVKSVLPTPVRDQRLGGPPNTD